MFRVIGNWAAGNVNYDLKEFVVIIRISRINKGMELKSWQPQLSQIIKVMELIFLATILCLCVDDWFKYFVYHILEYIIFHYISTFFQCLEMFEVPQRISGLRVVCWFYLARKRIQIPHTHTHAVSKEKKRKVKCLFTVSDMSTGASERRRSEQASGGMKESEREWNEMEKTRIFSYFVSGVENFFSDWMDRWKYICMRAEIKCALYIFSARQTIRF